MPSSMFYPLVGHVTAAAHSASHQKLAAARLKEVGFGETAVTEGLKIVQDAEALLRKRTVNYPDDKNLAHSIHTACDEVGRWAQTVRFRLSKAGFSPGVLEIAMGDDLHVHDHNLSVIAQGLRTIAIVRNMEPVHLAAIGSEQSVRDLLSQGNTLLKKLYRTADNFVSPSAIVPKTRPIHAEFDAIIARSKAWLGQLDGACAKVTDQRVFGLIGYTPQGVGLAVGGTGFNITLHQRAQTSAPDPRQAHVTSGWSVGRQGNNENLGQGWTPPEYGSVEGD